VLQLNGETATGIPLPADALDALGGGRRPKVRVTLCGHTYRTTVGSVDGVPMLSVSADVRKVAGISAGDRCDVTVEADTEPREVVVPTDLAAALRDHPQAQRFYESLSYSRKRAYVTWIEEARKPETRSGRVRTTVTLLDGGHAQR
jgi:hypothetical protein